MRNLARRGDPGEWLVRWKGPEGANGEMGGEVLLFLSGRSMA